MGGDLAAAGASQLPSALFLPPGLPFFLSLVTSLISFLFPLQSSGYSRIFRANLPPFPMFSFYVLVFIYMSSQNSLPRGAPLSGYIFFSSFRGPFSCSRGISVLLIRTNSKIVCHMLGSNSSDKIKHHISGLNYASHTAMPTGGPHLLVS